MGVTPEQRDAIFERLAEGESLRSICRDIDLPALCTVLKEAANDSDFAEQYARARATGDDAMAEDIQEIADDVSLDPQDRRVRIDARKWLLAKRQPKKYGDKLQTEITGKDGGPVQTEEINAARDEFVGRIARLAERNGTSDGDRDADAGGVS